ncbi:hypothetical protein N658DRAFT_488308 [Parathielavia hyrcaniae]|uniref:Uncharacterized protein n=1 Tax=Parathielavia hyrcaniae TaxID=113614 RepID=A0AAN6SZK2_9PEZI|nr:hypothetical protein N658DRAFT_488308 [Parathielavia hyrcaniae]
MLTGAHFFRLMPVVFAVLALILAVLALSAGNKPGVLDTYDIITIYTSGLGNNTGVRAPPNYAFPSRTTGTECDNEGLLGSLCDSMTSAASSALPPPATSTSHAGDTIDNENDNDNDVPDMPTSPTQKHHIRDFYSMYAMTVCEGDFTPEGGRTILQCHPFFSDYEPSTIPYLIAAALNLGVSGQNLSLSALGLTYPLESALDGLSTLLKAVAIIFCIGLSFAGLAFLSSIPTVSLTSSARPGLSYEWGVWVNLVFASSALFFLVLGGLVAAIGAKDAEAKVNGLGADAGVVAVAGTSWVTLAWAGIALMVVPFSYWVGRAVRLRKKQKAEKAEKKGDEEEGGEKQEAPSRGYHPGSRHQSPHMGRSSPEPYEGPSP